MRITRKTLATAGLGTVAEYQPRAWIDVTARYAKYPAGDRFEEMTSERRIPDYEVAGDSGR